jgi:hypothetical protein
MRGEVVPIACHAVCPTCQGPVWFGSACYQICCTWYFYCAQGPIYRYGYHPRPPEDIAESVADLIDDYGPDFAWDVATRWVIDPQGPEVGNLFQETFTYMRERERLEDFRGGHVACRGCKRLLYFAPETLATSPPLVCCGIAYVPTQHQVDLLIYDKLQPGELPDLVALPPPGPVEIAPEDEEDEFPHLDLALGADVALDDMEPSPTEEAELAGMAATPEQIAARKAERIAQITKRRGPQYG